MSEDLDRDLAIRRQRKKRFLGAPAPPQRLAQERSRKAPRLRRAMVDDETVDVVFTLYCATLVFSMQIGFTLLEVGSVSIRNTKNILLKNLLDLCVTSVVFYLFGYGLSNGESEHGFAGRDGFALTSSVFSSSVVETSARAHAHRVFLVCVCGDERDDCVGCGGGTVSVSIVCDYECGDGGGDISGRRALAVGDDGVG